MKVIVFLFLLTGANCFARPSLFWEHLGTSREFTQQSSTPDFVYRSPARLEIPDNRDASIQYVPVSCPVANKLVIFVVALDLKSQIMVAISHHVAEMPLSGKKYDINAVAQNLITAMNPSLLKWDHRMSVDIRAALDGENGETSRVCLNLILAHALLPDLKILSPVGREQLVANNVTPSRHNRTVLTRWNLEDKQQNFFNLRWNLVESIFAKALDVERKEKVEIKFFKDQLAANFSREMLDKIKVEAQSLKINDTPQIAKINRAWVYLDRGRAYGLKMGDRVVFNGEKIKGHVIGFYGPEEKVQSPRGFLVSEGAIVFIRAGQYEVKKGQEMTVDSKRFP